MVLCPICNNISYKRLKLKEWEIYKCKTCKASFLHPIPIENQKIYNEDYFKKWYISQYKDRKSYLSKLWKKIKSYIPKNGKILDIGCGIGIFMEFLKGRNYDIYGFEISPFALKICKEKKLKVFSGNFKNLKNQNNMYDVIVMMDVIAHIDNLSEYLNVVKKILKIKGILIIKTPLHSKYMFMLAKIFNLINKGKSILHLPAQIYHFDKISIFKVFNLKGFKIKKIFIVRDFVSKKFSFYYLWKSLFEKSIVAIIENE